MNFDQFKSQALDALKDTSKSIFVSTIEAISNENSTNNDIKWEAKTPRKGDHIRVNRGLYHHHGVYFSNHEIIHFTGANNDSIINWEENEVITSNINDFLRGGIVEVRIYSPEEQKDLLPTNEIHSYAKSCIGTKGYNLFLNNCEHFAYACTLGKHRSEQIDEIMSILDDNNTQSNNTLSSIITQQLKTNLNTNSINNFIGDNNISEITKLIAQYGNDNFKNNK